MSKPSPKGPIKYKVSLSSEQKEAKAQILDNTITCLTGGAGSGKTLLACNIALDLLFKRKVEKIKVTRPTVSKEDIGFLPGDLYEKMEPWIQPIYENMYTLYDKAKIDKEIQEGNIEIVPVSFMRGRTFVDSAVIVDEAQNVTFEQMEMIVTRTGRNSKVIICGDDAQIDLKKPTDTGFSFLYHNAKNVDGLHAIKLSENYRDPIVKQLLELYEKNK